MVVSFIEDVNCALTISSEALLLISHSVVAPSISSPALLIFSKENNMIFFIIYIYRISVDSHVPQPLHEAQSSL